MFGVASPSCLFGGAHSAAKTGHGVSGPASFILSRAGVGVVLGHGRSTPSLQRPGELSVTTAPVQSRMRPRLPPKPGLRSRENREPMGQPAALRGATRTRLAGRWQVVSNNKTLPSVLRGAPQLVAPSVVAKEENTPFLALYLFPAFFPKAPSA